MSGRFESNTTQDPASRRGRRRRGNLADAASFNIHDALNVRTNVPIVPKLPEHFRVASVNPDLEVVSVPELTRPPEDSVRSTIGHPGTCDLGGGEVYYECPAPFLQYLSEKAAWRFLVRGLGDRETRITTAFPRFSVGPIGSRLRDLLSRIVYVAITMKLARKGVALCHASAVAKGDDACVIFGYGGTGKTTLTAALMRSVCDGYLSDDYSLVDKQGRVYCWPEYYPPHTEVSGSPGLRYVLGQYRSTREAPFPIRKRATVNTILFLERGPDGVEELDADGSARRLVLLNMEELWRLWNSPVSQILGQYSYFYPSLDLAEILREYTALTASFASRAPHAFVVRSRGASFRNAQDLLAQVLGGRRDEARP